MKSPADTGPATCRLCGSPALKVMEDGRAAGPATYCECSECGSLLRLSAADPSVPLPLPADALFTRDCFSTYAAAKRLLGNVPFEGVSVVGLDGATGFLARMLIDGGHPVEVLRYHEKSLTLGKALNDHAVATLGETETREGRLMIVFRTLGEVEDPGAFVEAISRLGPRAILLSAEVYQGQDLSWEILEHGPSRSQAFPSYQGLRLLAERIGYRFALLGNACVLYRDIPDATFDALAKIVQREPGDLSDYLARIVRPPRPEEAAPAPRIYLNAPVGRQLYVDCLFYQMASTGIAKLWNEVFRIWAEKHPDKVVLLDRGGEIEDFGLPRIPFKRFDFSNPFAEIRALSWYLMRKGAYRFASTYYSYSEMLPTRAVVYDMIPENLSFDPNDPQWILKRAYLQRAESAFCISGQTAKDVARFFPALESKADYAHPGVSPAFRLLPADERTEFRSRIGVRGRYLVTIPCALGGYKDGVTALKALDRLPTAAEIDVVCTVPLAGQEALVQSFRNLRIRSLRLPDADYAKLIGASDLVVWTPLIEGFGLPPLEALVCRTPVVLARTAVNLELYGDLANYAEPSNVESFVAAISSVLKDGVDLRLFERAQSLRSYENFADRLFANLYD